MIGKKRSLTLYYFNWVLNELLFFMTHFFIYYFEQVTLMFVGTNDMTELLKNIFEATFFHQM